MAAMPWFCLVLFSAAFTATILATPWVIVFAQYIGALDAPDGFRKHQKLATPRMGGLAVICGLVVAMLVYRLMAPTIWDHLIHEFLLGGLPTLGALTVVLLVGLRDDRHGMRAMTKLAFQGLAACLLYADGFRIERIFLFGFTVDFGYLGLPATCFWFLACMNIWNLIDGMDGLASGVGTIVSITLLLAASTMGHVDVAFVAASLAGALAGFLMYNFHPAKIFLGDTGSLLIGLMLGMIAVRGSLKSGMTVAILVPVLAMGLPIVDTSLAIVRRWLRNLPFSVADRGHLHHRLMAFGLSQRQASLFLYSFSVLLCASALASVSLQSDTMAVLFAALGTVGLGVVFAARRDECKGFYDDLRLRLRQRSLERKIATVAWEGIQRLDNCSTIPLAVQTAEQVAQQLNCHRFGIQYSRGDHLLLQRWSELEPGDNVKGPAGEESTQLRFVLSEWPGEQMVLEYHQADVDLSLCTGGRFVSRFGKQLLGRLRQLFAEQAVDQPATDDAAAPCRPADFAKLAENVASRV